MGNTIQSRDLDLAVLGQAQVSYTVGAREGLSYDEAVLRAGLARTAALESALPAVLEGVNKRREKIEAISQALADIARVGALFTQDDGLDATKPVKAETAATCATYGIAGLSGTSVKKEKVQRLQADLQYALDVENNALQQDSLSLSGLVEKRDSAFSLIGKIVKKAIQAETTVIRYIQ